MTAYTTIANGAIDQDSPVTQPLMTALRDNPIAIGEGSAGAPRVSGAALGDFYFGFFDVAGNATTATIDLGTVQTELLWLDGIFTAATNNFEVRFSSDGGLNWGAWQALGLSTTIGGQTGVGGIRMSTGAVAIYNRADMASLGAATLTVPSGGVDAVQFRSSSGSVTAKFHLWLMAGRSSL